MSLPERENRVISNTGRLVALITASRAISYWNIPTTMMGLTQMAAEDIWLSAYNHNYTGTLSFLSSVSITEPLRHINWSATHSLLNEISYYHLIYLVLFLFIIRAMFYLFQRGPLLAKEWGITDNYYTNSIRKFYHQKISKCHASLIMSPAEQRLIVNNHLMEHNLFQMEYDRYMLFFHEYDNLPRNNYTEDLNEYKTLYIPKCNTRYYFNDPEANVHGYLVWCSKEITINVTKISVKSNERGERGTLTEDAHMKTTIPILKLVINKPVAHYLKYIEDIQKRIYRPFNLYFAHITQGNTEGKIYAKMLSSYPTVGDNWTEYFQKHYLDKERKHWIDTFFHPCKKEIWPKLETIHFNPDAIYELGQYPQASYCLYGPPGTGKSTLVYRVAKALGRGIISINLSGIKTTLELRKILSGIYLKKTSVCEDGNTVNVNTSPKYAVYVFDEFDKAFLALKAKSDLETKKETSKMTRLNSIFGYDDFMTYPPSLRGSLKRNRKRSLYPFPTSPLESQKFFGEKEGREEEREEETAEGNEREVGNDGEKEDEKENYNQLKTVINDFTQMEDDDLTVDSLLDIIQGPCANPGAIIFAITNRYEEIRQICPRLFRDGRFKPIYFGYPTRETVEEITQYYWNKSVKGAEYDFIPDVIRISTARLTNRIVDLIFSYKDNPSKQFQMFIDHLKYDLEHYKLSDVFKEYEKCSDTDMISISP